MPGGALGQLGEAQCLADDFCHTSEQDSILTPEQDAISGLSSYVEVEDHTFRMVIGTALLAMRVAIRRARWIMRLVFPFSSCTEESGIVQNPNLY